MNRGEWAPLGRGAEQFLSQAAADGQLSTRGLTRVLRLGRTLADCETRERIEERHLLVAFELYTGADGLKQW